MPVKEILRLLWVSTRYEWDESETRTSGRYRSKTSPDTEDIGLPVNTYGLSMHRRSVYNELYHTH